MEVPIQFSHLWNAQKALNTAMSPARVTFEWTFKEVKQYWSNVDFKRKMLLRESPIASFHLVAMLLINMRNCVYPDPISQYFRCTPSTLEDYLAHKDISW